MLEDGIGIISGAWDFLVDQAVLFLPLDSARRFETPISVYAPRVRPLTPTPAQYTPTGSEALPRTAWLAAK